MMRDMLALDGIVGEEKQLMCQETCACMRAIHMIDARVRTGVVKYRNYVRTSWLTSVGRLRGAMVQ